MNFLHGIYRCCHPIFSNANVLKFNKIAIDITNTELLLTDIFLARIYIFIISLEHSYDEYHVNGLPVGIFCRSNHVVCFAKSLEKIFAVEHCVSINVPAFSILYNSVGYSKWISQHKKDSHYERCINPWTDSDDLVVKRDRKSHSINRKTFAASKDLMVL